MYRPNVITSITFIGTFQELPNDAVHGTVCQKDGEMYIYINNDWYKIGSSYQKMFNGRYELNI